MTLQLQRSAIDAAKLKRLHTRIRACTKCVAAGYLDMAAPVVAGDITDRVMIVGQAPGVVELTTRTPFSGRAGAELRRWLGRAGIGEDALPYRTAITKCFPGKAATGAGDRRPSPPEIALCGPWLEAELALVRPDIILLVGTLAIDRLWGQGGAQRRRRTVEAEPGAERRAAHPAATSVRGVALAERPGEQRATRAGAPCPRSRAEGLASG